MEIPIFEGRCMWWRWYNSLFSKFAWIICHYLMPLAKKSNVCVLVPPLFRVTCRSYKRVCTLQSNLTVILCDNWYGATIKTEFFFIFWFRLDYFTICILRAIMKIINYQFAITVYFLLLFKVNPCIYFVTLCMFV